MVLALPILLGLVLLLALRTQSFRRGVLDRVGDLSEEVTGVHPTATDFTLRLWPGRLEVQDLELRAGRAAEPFLKVDQLVVEASWSSFLTDLWVIENAELAGPVFDLGAPLPPAREDQEETSKTTVEVAALQLREGRILGDPAQLDPDAWLTAWHVEDLELRGSLVDEKLQIELPHGVLQAERQAAEALVFDLRAALGGPLAGPYEVGSFEVSGEGLQLEAMGDLGLTPAAPSRLSFKLLADAARLIPDLTTAGRLEASGNLDPRALVGDLEAMAEDFPAEILAPWLGRELLEQMGLTDARLELAASLAVDRATSDELQGQATLRWQRPQAEPIALTAQVAGHGFRRGAQIDLAAMTAEVDLEAARLPAEILVPWLGSPAFERMGLAGSHGELEAHLVVANETVQDLRGEAILRWQRPREQPIELVARTSGGRFSADGQFDISAATLSLDLRGDDLRGELLEPWLGRDLFEQLGADGTHFDLNADLTLDSAATAQLVGSAEVLWRRGSEELMTLVASAPNRPAGGGVDVELAASLLPEHPGERRLEARLVAKDCRQLAEAELRQSLLRLDLPDLELALEQLAERWPRLVPDELEPWPVRGSVKGEARFSGALIDPQAEVELTWQLGDEGQLMLEGSGRPVARSGRAELDIVGLDLALVNPWLAAAEREAGSEDSPALVSGVLDGRLSLVGSLTDYEARLVIDGEGLRYGEELPALDHLHLEADGDPRELRLPVLTASSGDSRLRGSGKLALERPLRSATLELELEQPVEGIERLSAEARLDAGVLQLRIDDLLTFAGRGSLRAELPLGALAALPGWEETLAEQPIELASGPLELSVDFPVVEVAEILAQLAVEPLPQNLQAALRGELSVDLADPTALEGQLEIPFFTLATGEHYLAAEDPLRLQVAARRLEAQPFAVRADGQSFEVSRARVGLLPGWRFGQDPVALIAELELIAKGRLPASLLNAYLEGGLAEGVFDVELEAAGSLDRLVSDVRVRGPEASLTFLSPYLTRLEDPELVLRLEDGELSWRDGHAVLNDGELFTSGRYNEAQGLAVDARLDKVRYRLNLGLSVVAGGQLGLELDAAGRGRLFGKLVIDRGLLRREVNLDRELLGRFFAPTESIQEESVLDEIALELELATREGVRVKNNLADLRVTWSPLEVRGTLAVPILRGQIEVVPGGFVFAYGQTIRLDDATLTFPNDPNLEPDLDLMMTTSLDDPTIAREGARHFPVDLPSTGTTSDDGNENALAAGVVAHYGDQLVGRLGGVLGGGTSFSFGRPVLIFSEADPSRRLTVTRDLSTHVALAASVALDTEGQQTYLLDLHDFRKLPRLITQVFTNDQNNQGGALQQVLEFGGGRPEDSSSPLMRRLEVEAPEAVQSRGLRQAVGWFKGERLPEGAAFDSEVDVAEWLRRRGYPEARVQTRIEPVGDGKADLHVAIEPGPHVTFEFRGDKPPAKLRPAITTLYRLGFYQETTLEEMRLEAIRALEGEGYLDPRVEVSVEPTPGEEAPDDHRIVIEGFGGERVKWGAPIFEGLSDTLAQEQLSEAFAGLLQRVQLARGDAGADRRVSSVLERLGYPEARIVDRRLDKRRAHLTIVLEPGPRRQLRDIRVEGVDAAEAQRLLTKTSLAVGQPARLDLIAGAALILERDLRSRGFAEARVGWELTPATTEEGAERHLIFEVHDGPQFHIDAVRFTGLGATRPSWAERMAGIENGSSLDGKSIARARRNLFNARLFRSVLPLIDRQEDGRAVVTFDVEEGPRYNFAYGLRWETSEGSAVVFDVVDRNGFGRGVTLGLRGLYSDNDQSFRVYGALPRFLGTRADLELFVEGREFSDTNDGLRTSRIESTLQVAIPLKEALKTRFYARYRDTFLSEIDPFFPDFPFTLRTLSPVLGWQLYYDSRDDALDASRGLFASADLSGAGRFIASDFSFARFFGQVKHLWPFAELGRKRLTWAQAWRLGLAKGFAGQDVARPERFFAGGEYSVRGYDTDSLGPFDPLGDITLTRGGEALFVVNQELRLQISERFRGLLFVDAGNVWEAVDDLGSGLATSAGVGTRARTPIGLLRLDVAWPLDQRPDDDEIKIYFGFGNTF